MIAKASSKFVRISPRKVRYVIDLIRGKTVPQARVILSGSPRRAAGIIEKLMNQAVDAAKKNSQLEAGELKVSKVLADGGPSMKRFRAASMGRAGMILKRTSHLTLELDLIRQGAPVAQKLKTEKKLAPKIPVLAPEKKSAEKKSKKEMAGAK